MRCGPDGRRSKVWFGGVGRAHGGADGAAAKPWSLGEHPPSACGVCEREPSAYETGAVTKGFGS
ncbi:hypothetical protein GA0115239_100515 [Streptomyces sp. BpilaLS-43]|nr:hypothetical protein GA0115239_100515 [Streptomyces sp. BpilaLS-43]